MSSARIAVAAATVFLCTAFGMWLGSDDAPAAKPDQTAPRLADSGPEPEVDPDEAFLEAVRADDDFNSHMQTSIRHLESFAEAKTLSEGADAAHRAADTYDWLTERLDNLAESPDSQAAQRTMGAFRLCRDTYTTVAEAIDDVDPAAMEDASDDVSACNRELEAATSLF